MRDANELQTIIDKHYRLAVAGQCAECTYGDGRGPMWPCETGRLARQALTLTAQLAEARQQRDGLAVLVGEYRSQLEDAVGSLIYELDQMDAEAGKPVGDRLLMADGHHRVHDIRDFKAFLARSDDDRARQIVAAVEAVVAAWRGPSDQWTFLDVLERVKALSEARGAGGGS